MLRIVSGVVLIVLLAASTAAADTGPQAAPAPKSSSTGKHVAWTVVGAAAGFGAGLFLGLNKFDDAIDSDRKVWTSAIVGAAAGGVAAALLSRNIGRSSAAATPEPRPVNVTWAQALGHDEGARRKR
jgi:hypothetical protein